MRRLRVLAVLGLVAGLSMAVTGGAAVAVENGQFCADADAGRETTTPGGVLVKCLYNSASDRHHWTAIVKDNATTSSSSTTVATITPTTAPLAGDTRIISISPTPSPPAQGLLERTG